MNHNANDSAVAREASTGSGFRVRPIVRRLLSHRRGIGPAAVLLAVFVGTGCQSLYLNDIADEQDFRTKVVQSDKPVLVDFYKAGGCPTCEFLVPVMDKLAEEYGDRVSFTRFAIMQPYFVVTSAAIQNQYHIGLFPTVVLVVHGKEKQRWSLDYNADDYRRALDAVLSKAAPARAEVGLSPAPRKALAQAPKADRNLAFAGPGG
jgi:thiol-disulfide isomerase/thioredoxin